nr:hypothetical protein [Tanacetum cinerariifolium]
NRDGIWNEVGEEEDPIKVQAIFFYPRIESVEPLEWKALENWLKPSSIKPPKLELKELPKHLEYAFLQENNQLPVVISSALSAIDKAKLLEVLRNHKGAIALSIADIKGIDSSFYSMEVFMDDLSFFGNSFDHCLKNLEKMLRRGEETNLVLNWEKCHFMVKEGIILGHKVLGAGIEVDKAKIEAISKLPYPMNVKAIQRVLGHILLLQEFDNEIRDKKGAKNLAADHLSQIENPKLGKLTKAEIRDLFPKERLMAVSDKNNEPWFFARDEAAQILRQCHSGPSGGHHGISTTASKVFEAGFYWPRIFHDARQLVQVCDACQRVGNISSREETPQKYIQVYEIFKVWGIDFMINELDEMRLDGYESSISYKERTKRWHDKQIKALTNYERGDKRGDGVAGIKRHRRDLSSEGVRYLVTALGRGRLKEDLESSI